LLTDDNENYMLMVINCWILDHICSFFKIKYFVDLSTFASKSEHVTFLQYFIV